MNLQNETTTWRDGWKASPLQWTWAWANSRRWWGTGRPGILQSVGSKGVRHDVATEPQQMLLKKKSERRKKLLWIKKQNSKHWKHNNKFRVQSRTKQKRWKMRNTKYKKSTVTVQEIRYQEKKNVAAQEREKSREGNHQRINARKSPRLKDVCSQGGQH